jgi:hypothetical protein
MDAPNPLRDLLERCGDKDPQAIEYVWDLIERHTWLPFSRGLRRGGLAPDVVVGIWHGFFIYLFDDHAARLRRCRGISEAELVSFVHTVSVRFIGHRLRAIWRAARHAPRRLGRRDVPDRDGLDESRVHAVFGEFDEIATARDRKKFKLLRGQVSGESAASGDKARPSRRRIRRIQLELEKRYRDRVL